MLTKAMMNGTAFRDILPLLKGIMVSYLWWMSVYVFNLFVSQKVTSMILLMAKFF